ncbi:MogA/MoaB family molybdenum cofactor biosynthesis protein [Halosimplex salinum]|uniref:MogA/MoaB family molybdenum cofactor biosynthesis protein n=1 Tax=Halosimplex salinum TaxID=1710538 RepID=UPI002E269B57
MVDFQSRDTSRGVDDDEDEGESEEPDASANETESASADDAEVPGESAGEDETEGDAATERDASARAAPDQGEEPEESPDPSADPLAGSGDDDPLAPSTGDDALDDSSGATGDHPFADSADASQDPAAPESEPESSAGDAGSVDDEAVQRESAQEPESHGEGHGTDERSHDHAHADTDEHGSGGHDHPHEGEHGSGSHGHAHGAEVDLLGVAVVTVSSTRTHEDDPSGDVIEAIVEAADHEVVTREILRDDLDGVQTALLNLTGRDDVDVVVTTGGTGVTPDDVTVEGARPLFDRELPGFGELFRILSYEEIGTRAMASRATAGMVDGVPVFCLPGSEAAARLGTEELVVEEMGHLVSLARRE